MSDYIPVRNRRAEVASIEDPAAAQAPSTNRNRDLAATHTTAGEAGADQAVTEDGHLPAAGPPAVRKRFGRKRREKQMARRRDVEQMDSPEKRMGTGWR